MDNDSGTEIDFSDMSSPGPWDLDEPPREPTWGWAGSVSNNTIDNGTSIQQIWTTVSNDIRAFHEREEREEREMIPSTALLTLNREDAETQRALFAELPQLTKREEQMMAIYDAVIAQEKIVKLKEILNRGGALEMVNKPKVMIAPVTADVASFIRDRNVKASKKTREDLVDSWFQAGAWRMNLLTEEPYNTFGQRVSLVEAEALVPLIPPAHREGLEPTDLILWEPVWLHQREVVINADPAILRPLSHGLYKVVAAWDLSPVETMMLSGE